MVNGDLLNSVGQVLHNVIFDVKKRDYYDTIIVVRSASRYVFLRRKWSISTLIIIATRSLHVLEPGSLVNYHGLVAL